ncbi:MAG: tetratricopeptide repeat protein [Xenococcaceae cyanobacterium]
MEVYLQEGNQLREQGKLAEAINKYSEIILVNPNCVQAHHQLAEIYEKRKEFDRASNHYQLVVQLEPDNSRALAKLARVMMHQGNIEGAVTTYQTAIDQAISQKPKQPKWFYRWVYTELGEALEKNGQIEEAIAVYQKAIEIVPENCRIYPKLAKLIMRQGNIEGAVTAYQKAITQAQKPKQPKWFYRWVYTELGEALEKNGQIEEAIASYHKAIAFQPDHSIVYAHLARAMMAQKNTQEAITAYQKAIALQPKQPIWVYVGLGDALNQNGQVDEAIAVYQKAIDLYPKKPELYVKQSQWIFLHRKSTLKDFSQELKKISSEELSSIIEDNNYSLFDFSEINNLSKLSQKFSSYALELLAKNLGDWHRVQDESAKFKEFADKKQLSFSSPYTGQTLYTCKSLLINLNFIANIFACNNGVFYWIVHNVNQGEFVYIPEIEAVILGRAYKFSNKEVASIINNLKKYLIKNKEEFCTYIESKSETKSYIFLHQSRPFHYLSDRLGGLTYLESCGLLDKIDGFIDDQSTNYFEPTRLFPKILDKELIRIKASEKELINLQKFIYKNNGFVYFIRRLTQKNINPEYFLSAAESSRQEIETLASFIVRKPKLTINTVENIVDLIESYHPLVWIGIAVEKRHWIDQVEGIKSIIGELSKKFPNIGIIIDGMTGNDNQIFDIGNYQKLYEKEKQILSEIIMNIPEGIGVYSTIGMNARHKLFIAKRIDFYITQIGTQCLLPSFMAKKPGILHGHPGFLKWCHYDPNTAILIDKKHIVPKNSTETLREKKQGGGFQSYSLDWRIIYKEVKEKILPNLRNSSSQVKYR